MICPKCEAAFMVKNFHKGKSIFYSTFDCQNKRCKNVIFSYGKDYFDEELVHPVVLGFWKKEELGQQSLPLKKAA